MRILITGPECSGKTSLAKQLSYKLTIPWFPEYARTYLEEHGANYKQADILTIAREHFELVNVFPPDQPLILDTYLLNLKIWTEYKFNISEPWIDAELKTSNSFDFVFLLTPDLPWIQDGLRESEDNRTELFEIYKVELAKLNWDYFVISGTENKRIDAVLSHLIV